MLGACPLLGWSAPDPIGQRPEAVSVVVLSTGPIEERTYTSLASHLNDNLADLGVSLEIERRDGGFSDERLAREVDKALALKPRILICLDLNSAEIARSQRRAELPAIVFLAHDDPLDAHLIESYARPGHNLTGVTTFRCVDGKMVEILADAFPRRRRFGYLVDLSITDSRCREGASEAADRLGVRLLTVDVSAIGFLETVADRLRKKRLDAVIAPATAVIYQNREAIVGVLNDLQLPAIYESEVFLKEGGFLAYGPSRRDAMEQVARDVRKILQGQPAGNIPVLQPTLFELTVNLAAPHASSYGIRPATLRRADRIIQ
jgi:putative ABC transport system substrate-binding protein